MTIADIITAVRAKGFEDSVEIPDATILRWINTARRDIYAAVPKAPFVRSASPATLTVVNGTDSYTLDASVNRIISLNAPSSQGYREASYLELPDFLARRSQGDPGSSSLSRLSYYTVTRSDEAGVYIKVWPTPTASEAGSWEVWHTSTAADLIVSDSLDIPVKYTNVIIDLAVGVGNTEYFDVDDPTVATAIQEGEKALSAMVADLEIEEMSKTDIIDTPGTVTHMVAQLREMGFKNLGNKILINCLNDSLYRVASRRAWGFLESGPVNVTVESGSSEVTGLPIDFLKPKRLYNPSTHSRLEATLAEELFDDNNGYTATGVPVSYAKWGFKSQTLVKPDTTTTTGMAPGLRVYPTPSTDTTLQLVYYRKPTTLVNPTDVVDFPPHHQEVVVLGAAVKACDYISEMANRKEDFERSFNERIQEMIDDVQQDNLDMQGHIYATDEEYY
jgi:hypothetical protein